MTVEVAGFGPVLCCHGSPRDDEEVVLVDTRPERWLEAFADVPDEVRTIACGHTHMPFVRLVDRRYGREPGQRRHALRRRRRALGAARGTARSRCGRAAFDIPAACAQLAEQSAYPDVVEWADYYLNSRASDLEALAAFGPRDGREVRS